MIGRSWPAYVFIRIAILAIRLIAPLSIIYLAASYHANAFLWSPFLGVYAIVEASFYLLVYLPRSFYLQRDAKDPPRMSRAEREALFRKCANTMTAQSITGWFLRAPGHQIWRDNVVDWLLWALFSARTSDTMQEWEEELDYYTTIMAEYLGYPLRPGTNPEMQCLRPTFEPVIMAHRPFAWYMIVCVVDTLASTALYSQGFIHHNTHKWFHVFPPRPLLALFSRPSMDTVTNVPYWYRPHRSSSKLPIVFIHGIGIGLLPYIPFLRELAAQDPDVGIVAIEILPISMHITEPLLARDAMCDAILRILNGHGLRRIVLAGHSFGTAISAYLLRRQWGSADRPLIPPAPTTPLLQRSADHVSIGDGNDGGDLIAATLLMDPIPFLLHYPAVAYNFIYRQPRYANEWQLWYFASREADTSRTLSRHFFWYECILFREDVLGSSGAAGSKDERSVMPVAVSLSGRDQIVDGPAVHAYLTGGEQCTQGAAGAPTRWAQDELEVLFYPELDHATVFDTRQRRAPLLEVLHRFVRLESSEGVGEDGIADAGTSLDRLVDAE